MELTRPNSCITRSYWRRSCKNAAQEQHSTFVLMHLRGFSSIASLHAQLPKVSVSYAWMAILNMSVTACYNTPIHN
jgi:hypothetical protein